MGEKKWDSYIKNVLSHVKFKFDHKAIRMELTEHMEDLCNDLVSDGMDQEAAEYLTLAYMGDASEIGKELNEEHNAVLGWIWRISRVLFICVLLLCMPAVGSALSFAFGTVSTVLGDYEMPYYPEELVLVDSLDVEEEIWIDDVRLTVEEIRYYDNGELHICYDTFYKKNGRLHVWEGAYYEPWEVVDEKGNEGKWSWRGSHGSSIYRNHLSAVTGIPFDAEILHITLGREWKNISFDIQLDRKGDVQ